MVYYLYSNKLIAKINKLEYFSRFEYIKEYLTI